MECQDCRLIQKPADDYYYYMCHECREFIDHHETLCYKCSRRYNKCTRCGFNIIKSLFTLAYEKCAEIAEQKDVMIVELKYDLDDLIISDPDRYFYYLDVGDQLDEKYLRS